MPIFGGLYMKIDWSHKINSVGNEIQKVQDVNSMSYCPTITWKNSVVYSNSRSVSAKATNAPATSTSEAPWDGIGSVITLP